MFIKKFAEENFIDSFESNLKIVESQDKIAQVYSLNEAINFVRLAADLLDEIGIEKQASELTVMLQKIASGNLEDSLGHKVKDPHTGNGSITSEEMEEGLKMHGVPFKDHNLSDDENEIVVEESACCPECGGDIDDADDSAAKDKKLCDLCGATCNVSMVEDGVVCEKCVKEAQDCGMVYDCMPSWDANDAKDKNDAPKCKGWKKSPVGSPRQRAFCKRHCGMKKKLTSKKVADDPDSCINQGLRRWKCRCS